MKIDVKKLEIFLKKINVSAITEAIFNFEENGLKVSCFNAPNTIRLDAVLKKSAFEIYESIGKIGVQDIDKIIKIIQAFSKVVEITIEGNIINFKQGSKEVKTELVDIQFITEISVAKELEFEETFTVLPSTLQSFVKDVSVVQKINEITIEIRTAEKKFRLENSGKFKFKVDTEALESKGGTVAKFGQPLIDIIPVLTNNIQLSLAKDYPAKILEQSDDSVICYIVAPRIENEE